MTKRVGGRAQQRNADRFLRDHDHDHHGSKVMTFLSAKNLSVFLLRTKLLPGSHVIAGEWR
jgi:hypothetical protein